MKRKKKKRILKKRENQQKLNQPAMQRLSLPPITPLATQVAPPLSKITPQCEILTCFFIFFVKSSLILPDAFKTKIKKNYKL